MVNLALAWAEAYHSVDPAVDIAVTGGGSGTGIAALINNTVDIANASLDIKEDEVAAAQKNGVTPVEFIVAVDALAVIVIPAMRLRFSGYPTSSPGASPTGKRSVGTTLYCARIAREQLGTCLLFGERGAPGRFQ
jgi:hypothetical protein